MWLSLCVSPRKGPAALHRQTLVNEDAGCGVIVRRRMIWVQYLISWVMLIFWFAGCESIPEADPKTNETVDSAAKAKPAQTRKVSNKRKKKKKKVNKAGRWKKSRVDGANLPYTQEQERMIKQLEALGYMDGVNKAQAKNGVITHKKGKTYKGYNFFTSGHAPAAYLMNMNGKILHEWKYDFWKVWPKYEISKKNAKTKYFRKAYLYKNGDILAIFEGCGLIKLDKDSNLIWAVSNRAHHDLEILPNGNIYVLTRKADMIPRINKERPISEDFITLLNPEGEEIRSLSVLEALVGTPWWKWFKKSPRRGGDIFHTNTLSVLDGRIAKRIPALKKGNILTSMRVLNAIGVVDMQMGKFVWGYKHEFKAQHDPQIIKSGSMLLFDNKGLAPWSRVLEFDPLTKKMLWDYTGSKKAPFYSRTCGLSYRLPNGNTLIVESDNGRAFEVTQSKEVVWEYLSPNRAGPQKQFVSTLFDMKRIRKQYTSTWLKTKPRKRVSKPNGVQSTPQNGN